MLSNTFAAYPFKYDTQLPRLAYFHMLSNTYICLAITYRKAKYGGGSSTKIGRLHKNRKAARKPGCTGCLFLVRLLSDLLKAEKDKPLKRKGLSSL
ncbi:hypothetical protein C4H11_09225 [Bacteroides zoogleoformans]|uniref:Uncharacterized protein n=1 Tax=Bacteroides zoogleoformans TaxID=28119 RepID=A0ABN5IK33_9BACE|nr:hypothetical protein C4H11_09225 [Bacteroides zoogleoformans]